MKRIILIALSIYTAILLVGGAVYVALNDMKTELPPPRKQVEQTELAKQASDAQAHAEAAEKAAKEAAEKSKQKEQLIQALHVETRNGLTLYTGNYPKKPAPGVYLRPFVVSDGASYALKFDVYYYYDISDPQQTAWVHGDALAADVDGASYHLSFKAHDRRDKMSPDAESLAESYVHDATSEEFALLRAIGNAQSVQITYYQQATGDARSQTLSHEDIRKIHDMMAFYNLVSQETDP